MESAIQGPAVKKAREAHKLSQAEVSNAISLNRVYYSLFEAGRYVLNQDERKRLSTFLSAQGIQHTGVADRSTTGDQEPAVHAAIPSSKDAIQSDPDEQSERDADARLMPASHALRELHEVAESTGIISKRTAGLVLVATGALQALDYADLLSIAQQSGIPLDGLLPLAEFEALELAEMQLWESRAAGVLICESLYGESWRDVCFDNLKEVEAELRKSLPSGEPLIYRARGLGHQIFGYSKEFCPLRRADLAPYIAKVASERSAPALTTALSRASAAV